MNKTELVEAISHGTGMTKVDTNKVLDHFMQTIASVLKQGGEIYLPSFGTFSVGSRSARTGRNPQTGATIQIAASRVPKFKAGKKLKDAVQ